ncbi:MAG TPA: flagellar hook-associated protein FlgL [Caldimonas sp.]|jgi:flagellar hook-associated protein 3 FlgL|nr:flagellar hook-associated protein FlgL [Caldimonas sp.]HEX4236246.1 flagellar hook-associated protein FlgL [Caldimonas sp.]
MRIATANTYDAGIDTLTRRQAEMNGLQEQMTTGLRVNRASDDPAAAARAERALAAIGRSDTSQRAVNASSALVTQSESTLGDAGDLLQRARELMVSAGNASYSDSDRKSIADELQSIRDQLLSLANTSDGAGTYVFGGQGSTQKPFVETASGVQYVAANGDMRTENGTSLPLTTDGQAIWLQARTGNGVFVTSAAPGVANATIDNGQVTDPSALTGADYTLQFSVSAGATTYAVLKNGSPTAVTAAPYVSGQAITVDGMSVSVSGTPADGDQFQIAPSTPTLGVFGALDQAIAGLQTTGRTGSQVAQANADSLRDIDSALGNLQSARSAAGAVLNRIDSETSRLSAQKLASTTEQSNAQDVDMVHAISDFQTKQNSYDAALKSYATVQRLSLFQYVNGG